MASTNDKNTSSESVRVAVIGAGFSGALFASNIQKELRDIGGLEHVNIQLRVYEQSLQEGFSHWTQPQVGAGLNINANGMACIRSFNEKLYNNLRALSLPRKRIKVTSVDARIGNLFNISDTVEAGLSDCHGAMIRWADANRTVRDTVSDIHWGKEIVGYTYDENSKTFMLRVKDLLQSEITEFEEGPFDFVVATDGRYSSVRLQSESVSKKAGVPVVYDNVRNFRLIVPDNSGGLFGDDLELFYNLPSHSDSFSSAFKGLARVGIARCPATAQNPADSLYIFGNFAVECDEEQDIAEEFKKFPYLKKMFSLEDGAEGYLTPQGRWLLETLEREAPTLHWARFQHIEPKFSPNSPDINKEKNSSYLPILYLGDCAHAFPPSLGQGATSSIEDGYAASQIFLDHVRGLTEEHLVSKEKKHEAMRDIIEDIARQRKDRIEMIQKLSIIAGEHIASPTRSKDHCRNKQIAAMQSEVDAWTNDNAGNLQPSFRQQIKGIWSGYPRRGVKAEAA